MFIFLSCSCSGGIWIRCIQIVILLCFKVVMTWFGLLLSSKFNIFAAVWNILEYWTTGQPNPWDQILQCWHLKLKHHAHYHGACAIFELTSHLCAAYGMKIESKAIYTHLSKRSCNKIILWHCCFKYVKILGGNSGYWMTFMFLLLFIVILISNIV